MASILCATSSLPLTSITKINSGLQLQQKPNSLVSFSSVHSQARHESNNFVLPLFSHTHGPETQLSSRTSTTATKANSDSQHSTSTEVDQTVEHIVFLQMRDPKDKPKEESREALKTALNSLKCLPGTLYLSAGYVGELYSPPGPFNFFLHSRLATKKHRDLFMQHPLKYGFSMGYTEGLCDDFMMLDYIHKHTEPLDHPRYGYALRFIYLKLKDGVEESSLQGMLENSFPGCVTQPTFGHIIEPCFTVPGTEADAVKGYNLGMHAAFPNRVTLDASGTPEAFAKTLKNKLGEALVDNTSVFIHDYIVDQAYRGTFV